MRHLVTIIALAATTAGAGCGKSHRPAGDAGGVDTGATDAGPDATDPCAFAGCAPPPDCETGCTAKCGCCGCAPGTGSCTADRQAMRVCTGGSCYERIACEEGAACEMTEDGPRCVAADGCDAIEAKYLELTSTRSCGTADDCHLVSEHCGVGLGGCHGVVNDSVTQEQLDELAERWTANECFLDRGVCSCAPPPPDETVDCEGGECTAG